MAALSTTAKNDLATRWAASALYAELTSNVPTLNTPGTPVASVPRVAISWSAPTAGVLTASVQFTNIPSGSTAQGVNYYTASTGGTFYDGSALASSITFPAIAAHTVALTESHGV